MRPRTRHPNRPRNCLHPRIHRWMRRRRRINRRNPRSPRNDASTCRGALGDTEKRTGTNDLQRRAHARADEPTPTDSAATSRRLRRAGRRVVTRRTLRLRSCREPLGRHAGGRVVATRRQPTWPTVDTNSRCSVMAARSTLSHSRPIERHHRIVTLQTGHTYRYRVRAVDSTGHAGAWKSVGPRVGLAIPDASASIDVDGRVVAHRPEAYLGGQSHSTRRRVPPQRSASPARRSPGWVR